jgi:hypothetical protein
MRNESITTDLRAKGRASSLILLQTVKELTEKEESAPPYFIARFKEVIDEVKGATKWHEAVLADYRREITEAVRELFTLNIYADVARDWTLHGGLLNVAATTKFDGMPDGEDVFQSLLQAILDIGKDDADATVTNVQQSLAYIPLRMATLKYKGYVSDAFKSMKLPISAGDANDFCRFFNPAAYLSGDGWLAGLKAPLDEVWARDCTVFDTEIVKDCLEKINALRGEITNTLDCLFVLLDCVNAALISVKCGEYPDDETRGLTDEQLDRAIDKAMGEIVYGPAAENRPDDAVFREIHGLFYETGLDHFTVLEKRDVNAPGDVNGFLAEFLPMLDIPEAAANRRRFLRQHRMSYLQYPYPIEQYKQYFIDTYNALDDANRMYMAAYVTTQVNKAKTNG